MRTEEHATDRPHNAWVARRFIIRGIFGQFSFINFIVGRASWLSIDGWISPNNNEITVVAAGPEAIVGAFEMALMLGPLDALVQEFEIHDWIGKVEPGFQSFRNSPVFRAY